MDRLTRSDLARLAETEAEDLVSIYMPVFRAGREARQNAIRYRNLLHQALDRLSQQANNRQMKQRLREAMEREPEESWWPQSDGVAMFVSADRVEQYRLPLAFQERVVVGPRFFVKPLLPLFQGDGRFYLLAVSQNAVRLFEASRYTISQLEPAGLPKDLQTALNIDEYFSTLGHHATGFALAEPGTRQFHGSGGSGMDVKKRDELQEYMHRLDQALSRYFHEERAPLVFAGVEYLFPLFRATCQYNGLVDTPVPGNPDGLSPQELHDKAWAVVEPLFQQGSAKALARYQRSISSGQATAELSEILQASEQGQVDSLLVAEDAEMRGAQDTSESREVAGDRNGAIDLIDRAIVQTLAARGEVYLLPRQRMPDGKAIVANLRYPLVPQPALAGSQQAS